LESTFEEIKVKGFQVQLFTLEIIPEKLKPSGTISVI
jgi:hypothetical protein